MKISKNDFKGIGDLVGVPVKKPKVHMTKEKKARLKQAAAILRKQIKAGRGLSAQVGGPIASNPSWVQDEAKWTDARKAALKDRDADHPMYWGLVAHHYKTAGGRVRPGVESEDKQ